MQVGVKTQVAVAPPIPVVQVKALGLPPHLSHRRGGSTGQFKHFGVLCKTSQTSGLAQMLQVIELEKPNQRSRLHDVQLYYCCCDYPIKLPIIY